MLNQLSTSGRFTKLLRLPHTNYVWLIVSMLLLANTFRAARWEHNDVFVSDMGGYYLYLPSAFLTKDLGNGEWVKAAFKAYRPEQDQSLNLVPLPTGKVVFKFPMGMAVAYAPFFFLARTVYFLQGTRAGTGYEPLYQYAVTLGCVAYVLLGLWILGAELRRYFADEVAALTILVITLGSNLFTYGSYEVLMSHGTLLLLNALLLRYTRRWYGEGSQWADALGLGLVGGLMVLIRPSEAMLLAVPVLWGLSSHAAVAARLRLWRQRWGQALLVPLLVLLIGGQQFVFWRLVGEQWVIPFYKGETFHFDDPHVLDGLFSFRKGWLVYSPIMALALLGVAWVRRWAAPVWPLLVTIVPIYIYVTFCWWNWEYGGSYGGRALISLYPLLAFGMAAFWQRWLRPGRWALGPFIFIILIISIVQNYQYLIGLLSCCDMTWEKYQAIFMLLGWPQ